MCSVKVLLFRIRGTDHVQCLSSIEFILLVF